MRAHTLIAEAWGMIDSTSQALAHLDTAIALNPRFAQARLQRANLLSKLRQYGQAAEDLESLVDLIPEDAGNWMRLGNTHAKAGNHAAAAEAFRTAVAMHPAMPDPLFRFAEESVAAGNSEEGMHAYEKFMLTFPTDSRALKPNDAPEQWGAEGRRTGGGRREEYPKKTTRLAVAQRVVSFGTVCFSSALLGRYFTTLSKSTTSVNRRVFASGWVSSIVLM
ncbi:MAG: Tetratricopeptide repeat protein [Chlorobi bacterium OLB7]|nr:MAG: Tetratricopeptide repeat protein [Chlorobi bacterium OLB7]